MVIEDWTQSKTVQNNNSKYDSFVSSNWFPMFSGQSLAYAKLIEISKSVHLIDILNNWLINL